MSEEMIGGRWYRGVPVLPKEEVVDQQGARYGERWFRASGKLFLTTKRLIFCPGRNVIGPSAKTRAFDLDEVVALGRHRSGWTQRFLIWGQNTDAWFVDVDGERHWFDLGLGWNKMWVEKLAKRLGLTVVEIDGEE